MVETREMGRGIIAIAPINRGEILEHATSVVVTEGSYPSGIIGDYLYNFPRNNPIQARAVLGFGMVYNHSKDHSNADWVIDEITGIYTFYTLKPVRAGEEIFLYYGNYNPDEG